MFLDVSTLKVGDRVVRVDPSSGEWIARAGWNAIPSRVTAVYPEKGAFRVECFHEGNTYGGRLVGRDFGWQWPKGHHKAKPFAHAGLWALAPIDYQSQRKAAGYERMV